MNKKTFLRFMIISIVLALISSSALVCTYKINSKKTSKDISKIRVDKLKSNSSFEVIKSFDLSDEKNIDDFINAIKSKNRVHSKIDIRTPDYIIEIVIQDETNEEYNLWVGENTKGILMSNEKVWELSIDSTTKLKNLLESNE